MRHETKLLKLVANAGLVPSTSGSTESFLNNKISRLYAEHQNIRKFLNAETAFLPKSETAANRWRYYKAGETKAHVCPVCHGYVEDFFKMYCCHDCSTKAPNTGAKRGPKVDLVALATDLRQTLKQNRPDYKLVEYGRHRSTFKHRCGNVFELGNRALLEDAGSCPCQHKKLVRHTLATLRAWHQEQKTGWLPVRITGSKEAVLEGTVCGHRIKTRKFYDRRCPKCFKSIFASNIVTQEDYVAWVAKNRPKFEVVGQYVNCRTKLEYRHKVCGQFFKYLPGSVARKLFRCPACAPRSCGAYVKFKHRGITLDVRGKENIALQWILKNTSITLDDIAVDSEGTVPKITYTQLDGTRKRRYKPDFFVRTRNLIVEVKDCRTFGLGKVFFYKTGKELFNLNCTKAKACLEQGYKFNMLLFDRQNKRVVLPKLWHTYSHTEILKWAKQRKIIV